MYSIYPQKTLGTYQLPYSSGPNSRHTEPIFIIFFSIFIVIVTTYRFPFYLHFYSLCIRRYTRKTIYHLGGPSSAALRPRLPIFKLRSTILTTFQGILKFCFTTFTQNHSCVNSVVNKLQNFTKFWFSMRCVT